MPDLAPSDPPRAIDGKHFRAVLGHFPTGVTVVTGVSGDHPVGFTIGSFTSVSLQPPLVAFLPMVSSETWAAMAPHGAFCVNVLRNTQSALCRQFARKEVLDDRFDDVTWHPSPITGCPILDGAGAWIDCSVDRVLELGDHYLVIGAVLDLDHHAEIHVPLVFYKGELGGFSAAE
jgi:3-hydroxy-9,10-secoandrosta-1,3,5(10)-triene-9,17-dione monooxygenase reductase component